MIKLKVERINAFYTSQIYGKLWAEKFSSDRAKLLNERQGLDLSNLNVNAVSGEELRIHTTESVAKIGDRVTIGGMPPADGLYFIPGGGMYLELTGGYISDILHPEIEYVAKRTPKLERLLNYAKKFNLSYLVPIKSYDK